MDLQQIKCILDDYLGVQARNEARELIRQYFPDTKFWSIEIEEVPYEVWYDTLLSTDKSSKDISLRDYFIENNLDDTELREIFTGNPLDFFDSAYHEHFEGFSIEDEELPELPEELEKYK